MYEALAKLLSTEVRGDSVPAVITRWKVAKIDEGAWRESTLRNMERVCREVAAEFVGIYPAEVTAPLIFRYLKRYNKQWRTHNLHRSVIKQVLSYAALEGLREGHNPADDVPQARQPKRIRIVTPKELDSMAEALMTAKRGGPAHVRMLGLCLKTGQRIGDVLKFGAQHCTDAGIEVDQGKGNVPLLIEWDAELRALVEACYEGRDKIGPMLIQSTGKPYRYSGVRSAWVRAMAKAGIDDLHIHDLRGEAGARLTDLLGPYAAQMLLGHSSVRMTEHYTKGKTRRRVKPAPLRKVV